MPVIIKNRTEKSPGIIVFTHGEALWGVVAKSSKVKNFVTELSRQKKWIFGIHIQGNIDWLGEWQNFFMWPNKNQKFLEDIPKEIITDLTCINFYNDELINIKTDNKKYDIINITRFSSLKKIGLSLRIQKELLKLNPELKIIFISPVPYLKNKFFLEDEQKILNKTKNIIQNEFSINQLKQINFICSPEEYFNKFPLSNDLIYHLISLSKNLLMTSHMEGVPRAIVEAINLRTNIIVSEKLICGTTVYQNERNSFVYQENKDANEKVNAINIAKQINNYLKKDFANEDKTDSNLFLEKENIPKLKNFFKNIFLNNSLNYEDNEWYLHDLPRRLACHGELYDLTIQNNEKAFFNWFQKISSSNVDLKDEESLYKESSELDKIKTPLKNIPYWFDFYKTKFVNKICTYKKKYF